MYLIFTSIAIIILIILFIILRGIIVKNRACKTSIFYVNKLWDEFNANTPDEKDKITSDALTYMYKQQNSSISFKFTIDIFKIICPILFQKYDNEIVFMQHALEYGLLNGYISNHFCKQFYDDRLKRTLKDLKIRK